MRLPAPSTAPTLAATPTRRRRPRRGLLVKLSHRRAILSPPLLPASCPVVAMAASCWPAPVGLVGSPRYILPTPVCGTCSRMAIWCGPRGQTTPPHARHENKARWICAGGGVRTIGPWGTSLSASHQLAGRFNVQHPEGSAMQTNSRLQRGTQALG